MYFMPLAAGTWGGQGITEAVARQGRDLAAQLLANSSGGAIIAFNMQGGSAERLEQPRCHIGNFALVRLRLPAMFHRGCIYCVATAHAQRRKPT
jgi:hypothetical protein